MKIQKTIAVLAVLGVFMAISGTAQAVSMVALESTSTDAGLSFPAARVQHDDLLYGLTPTSSFSEATFLVGDLARLNDDIASDISGGVDGRVIPADSVDDWVLTYDLGGICDLAEVRVYSNNPDKRVGQNYDLAYSTDGVNYLPIADGISQLFYSADNLMSRVWDSSGAALANDATHLRLTFHPVRHYNDDPAEPWNGHSSLYEIDAFATSEAVTEVAYREVFPSDIGINTPIDTVGWKLNYDATGEAYDGSLTTEGGPLWNASAPGSPGAPTDLAGVNSSPHLTDEVNGYIFFHKGVMSGDHNVLAWTDEVATCNLSTSDLAEISWYESNSDDTAMRLALKIDGNWYVNSTAYVYNTEENGMTVGAKMGVYDFSEANWNALLFTPGTEMIRDSAFISLPAGLVEAAGVYTDDMTIDAASHRFDTFEILTFATEEPLPGDANKDGKVDGSDVTILAGNWQIGVDGTVEATWEMGDFNGDKKVDGSDVTILAGNWQAGVTSAAASVPEPGCIALLVAGIASLGVVIRKRQ